MKTIRPLLFVLTLSFSLSALSKENHLQVRDPSLVTPVLTSSAKIGVQDVKIVNGNCVISKLGLTGPIPGSPCAKLYPMVNSVNTNTATPLNNKGLGIEIQIP
jgi:hypothetical protein